MRPVVVGIDGSPASDEALRVAIREAMLRAAHLRVVHVWHVPEGLYLSGYAPDVDLRVFENDARELLAAALTRAGAEIGAVHAESVLREGPSPARALIDEAESHNAELLVVGTRGLSGLREAVLGSVSHACCRHARCPVLVVPDAERLHHTAAAAESSTVCA
jgi:nucleotide-binding universal stress UspA family protein